MLIGMICQVTFGILTGAVKIYGVHVLFRCLSAVSCALMYTSGTMICKILFKLKLTKELRQAFGTIDSYTAKHLLRKWNMLQ